MPTHTWSNRPALMSSPKSSARSTGSTRRSSPSPGAAGLEPPCPRDVQCGCCGRVGRAVDYTAPMSIYQLLVALELVLALLTFVCLPFITAPYGRPGPA